MTGDRPADGSWGSRLRLLATLAVLAVLLVPLALDRDSHPLSTYPMYAGTRDAEVALVVAIGRDSSGERLDLSLDVVARVDDPLIAEARLRDAVAADQGVALCAEIAGRAPEGVTGIEIATERHDVVARARGDDSLLDRRVHATCPA